MTEVVPNAALRKSVMRLLPYLFLLYVVAYLDRVNVGFAQLQLQQDLKFSKITYGFGSGIFFVGYFLFEVPSNLILERVGARRWIARIMVTWGIVAMLMCLIHNALTFYVLRFLLGLAEAGFFPGILLYMTYWFTSAERARIVAWFMTANAAAFIIGGPISGALLTLRGVGGLAGWQWLFLVEGLPAILLGVVTFFYLPDGPEQAGWLSREERAWLAARLAGEQQPPHSQSGRTKQSSLEEAFRDPNVWRLCALYFTLVAGMYGLSLWLPQLIKAFHGLSDLQVGFLTAIPYLAAAVSMVLVATHSDRTGERRLHVAGAAFVGMIGLILTSQSHHPVGGLIALSVAAGGMWATLGPFWALPTAFLNGQAAAGGLALINAVGNLGGFVGPFVVGYVQERTHNATASMLLLAGSLLVSTCLALTTREAA